MVLPETLRLWRRWFVALALDARARFLPVAFLAGCRRDARATMALLALSADEQCIIFSQLCNVLDPGIAGLQQRESRAAGADAGAAAAAEG